MLSRFEYETMRISPPMKAPEIPLSLSGDSIRLLTANFDNVKV